MNVKKWSIVLLAALMLLLAGSVCAFADTYLFEGFETIAYGTLPAGWTSENDNDSLEWRSNDGDWLDSNAYDGGYNAFAPTMGYTDAAYLVMPEMDLSAMSEANLQCYFRNAAYEECTDRFGIIYRVNGGAWNLESPLYMTYVAHSEWTEVNVSLPTVAGLEVAFYAFDGYGYGVALDNVTITTTAAAPAGVAQIGDTTYATLQEAFAAAQDGDTITLLDNCNGDGIIVPQGKFQPNGLIVDFAGYTFDMDGTTVGSAGTETLAFQLLKDNNLTFKNGTITTSTNSCKMILQNYSNLTLDSMDIDGTHSTVLYAVSNNNGETLIKDCTITANETGVAFDVWYGMSTAYPSVAVTVQNSIINGDVEVGAHKNANMANIATNMGLTITDSVIIGDINNSSAAVNKDAVEAISETIVSIDENTTIAGDNNLVPAPVEPEVPTTHGKTLIVYNLDKVDGQARIAVFAGVDSLNYERVGFEITQNGVTKVYTTRWVSTAVSVDKAGDVTVYEAADFENGAQYVFGQIIDVEDDTPVTVRAFAINNAGQQVVNAEAPAVEDAYTMMTIEGTGQGATGGIPNPPAIPGF